MRKRENARLRLPLRQGDKVVSAQHGAESGKGAEIGQNVEIDRQDIAEQYTLNL